MSNANSKTKPQDDSDYDPQENDLRSRYNRSLYDNNANIDDLEKEDRLPITADLTEGLWDDAFGTYDLDDATLPANNPEDVIETGLEIEDADDLSGKDKIGDIVTNINDYLEEPEHFIPENPNITDSTIDELSDAEDM